MNLTFLHLTLVHIPILFVPLAVLLLILALLKSNQTLKATSLALFILSGVIVIPAFLLGEEAEESVEHIAAVNKHDIKEHEESADFAVWLTVALGVLAIGQIATEKFKPESARHFTIPLIVLGIVSSASLSYTAWEGGKIRHPEAHSQEKSVKEDS